MAFSLPTKLNWTEKLPAVSACSEPIGSPSTLMLTEPLAVKPVPVSVALSPLM